jgi:hypothetical protein
MVDQTSWEHWSLNGFATNIWPSAIISTWGSTLVSLLLFNHTVLTIITVCQDPVIPSASGRAGKMAELPPRYFSSPLTNERYDKDKKDKEERKKE